MKRWLKPAAIAATLLCVPFAWAGVEDYSTTPASNTSPFPDNVLPSAVHSGLRQLQADTRAWFNDAQWIEYGDGDGAATVAHASATSFTIAGSNQTAVYHAGRRVKAVGSSTGTIYGTISSSSFSTNTTVNVTWDSGALQNEALTIYIGAISAANSSFPPLAGVQAASEIEVEAGTVATKYVTPETLRNADVTLAGVLALTNRVAFDDWQTIASATTVDLATATSNNVAISGTATVTGFGTVAAGSSFNWRATGAWTVTFSANVIGPQGITSGTYGMVAGVKGKLISRGAGVWDFILNEAAVAGTASMEAATTTVFVVTPGRQHLHPSAAKAWCYWNGDTVGTNACARSYGVTDVTRVSAGVYTVNFATAFSDTNYACTLTAGAGSGTGQSLASQDGNGTKTTTAFPVRMGTTGGSADRTHAYIVCFGDQ